MKSVISVAYISPQLMTIAMPRESWLPLPLPKIRFIIARTVVSVVIRMGRIRVLPVAISAFLLRRPPIRSWFA